MGWKEKCEDTGDGRGKTRENESKREDIVVRSYLRGRLTAPMGSASYRTPQRV